MPERDILHVDQNCFFSSVEMKSHPEWRDIPMAVGGDSEQRHGIILAKNPLAQATGVKTAEAIWQAKTKCPDLVCLPAHYERYEFYSNRLREMFAEYTDKVEPFGLDECWLDMTGVAKDYEDAERIALEIRTRVKEEFRLTCSIGISFNKIFAKLGSDYKKPDATTVFRDTDWKEKIWPLDASELLFVGRSTEARLKKINVITIGDLAKIDYDYIVSYLGKQGEMLWNYANGLDNAPVMPVGYQREIKSVGNSTTTSSDMTSESAVEKTMHGLAASVASRLRKHSLKGTVIQIHIRDRDLNISEHQRQLYEPTDSERVIYENAMELFRESYDWHTGIRSIGVRCAKVVGSDEAVQLSMFSENTRREKDEKLGKVIDLINMRYGPGVIKTAAEAGGEREKASHDPFHPEEDEFL